MGREQNISIITERIRNASIITVCWKTIDKCMLLYDIKKT